MSTTTDFVVLVVEDEEEIRKQVAADLGRLPNVIALQAAGKASAIDAIHSHYIDAAVVDIEMPPGSPVGLDVLEELAARSPNALVVIASRFLAGNRQRLVGLASRKAPRILSVFNKLTDEPRTLITPIEEVVATWNQSAISLTGLNVLEELLWTPGRIRRIGLRAARGELTRELDRICRDLFGLILGVDENNRSVHVAFTKLDREGLSSAVTVLASVTLGKDRAGNTVLGSHCVVKVGPVAEIRQETERYDSFVKFGVPLAQRVEMLSRSFQDHLGGICYSFAGGVFGTSLKTVDEILRTDGGVRFAETAFRQLFDPDDNNWYGVACGEVSPRYYMQRTHGTDFDRCYEVLHRSLEKLVGKVPAAQLIFRPASEGARDPEGHLRFEGGRLLIPPRELIGSQAIFAFRPACLVHGDMHGGNVMVELGDLGGGSPQPTLKRVCLIDYRSAGPAPRPLDFLAMQASVRLADAHALTEAAGARLTGDAWAALLKTAAQRVHAEKRILRETWSDGSARPAQGTAAARPPWDHATRTLIELMRANFDDMQLDEYLASAIPCALRQCSFDIPVVARVRMLAWLSALYEELTSSLFGGNAGALDDE